MNHSAKGVKERRPVKRPMPSLTARTPGKYNPGMTTEGAFSQQPPEKRPKDGDEDDQSFFGRPIQLIMYSLGQKFRTFKWDFFSSLPGGDR